MRQSNATARSYGEARSPAESAFQRRPAERPAPSYAFPPPSAPVYSYERRHSRSHTAPTARTAHPQPSCSYSFGSRHQDPGPSSSSSFLEHYQFFPLHDRHDGPVPPAARPHEGDLRGEAAPLRAPPMIRQSPHPIVTSMVPPHLSLSSSAPEYDSSRSPEQYPDMPRSVPYWRSRFDRFEAVPYSATPAGPGFREAFTPLPNPPPPLHLHEQLGRCGPGPLPFIPPVHPQHLPCLPPWAPYPAKPSQYGGPCPSAPIYTSSPQEQVGSHSSMQRTISDQSSYSASSATTTTTVSTAPTSSASTSPVETVPYSPCIARADGDAYGFPLPLSVEATANPQAGRAPHNREIPCAIAEEEREVLNQELRPPLQGPSAAAGSPFLSLDDSPIPSPRESPLPSPGGSSATAATTAPLGRKVKAKDSKPSASRKTTAPSKRRAGMFHPPARSMLRPGVTAPSAGALAAPRGRGTAHFPGTNSPAVPTDEDFAKMGSKRSRGRKPMVLSDLGIALEDANDPKAVATPEQIAWAGLTGTGKPKRVYCCRVPTCLQVFKRSEHLKRHVRAIHTLERPFQCHWPSCKLFFNRHDNLFQHLRVHRKPGQSNEAFSAELEACFGERIDEQGALHQGSEKLETGSEAEEHSAAVMEAEEAEESEGAAEPEEGDGPTNEQQSAGGKASVSSGAPTSGRSAQRWAPAFGFVSPRQGSGVELDQDTEDERAGPEAIDAGCGGGDSPQTS